MSQPQGPGRTPRPQVPGARAATPGQRGGSAPRATRRTGGPTGPTGPASPGGQAGRRGSGGRSPRPRLRKVLLITGLAGLGVLLLGALGFLYVYSNTAIPSVNDVSRSETSIMYFSDGKTELARVSSVNRESVPLAEIPKHVRNAMLAAEDRGFYDNPGVSPTGLARAVWSALRGEATQGGSTITQQYVKNSRLNSERTMSRKLNEIVISLKIERELSKDQILENYLNTIYYGRGSFGIKTAAKAYFNKQVKDLTVGEAALLASVVNGPSLFDPSLGPKNLARAKERVAYVLDGMVEKEWLSAHQRARTPFPTVLKPGAQGPGRSGPNGYLIDVVRNELVRKGIVTEDEVDRGGLRVVTTINRNVQQKAIEAVMDKRPKGGKAGQIRVGLASVKPGDGAILALYGGDDFRKTQWNDATQTHLQAGSTFKVFTLVAALQKGISTKTRYDGSSPMRPKGWSTDVSNSGGHDYGVVDLREATAKSVNTVFAQLNADVGPAKTREVAVAMGIPRDNGMDVDESTPGLNDLPSNVLGTAATRVIDMADAYATLAAGGMHAEPYIVKRVTNRDESFVFDAEPDAQRVLSPEVAADAVDAMEGVLTNGTASRTAGGLGRPAAGKTGTTDENKAVWFVGFTPQVSTAVGMYLPDKNGGSVPMKSLSGFGDLYGGDAPAAVWKAFMGAYLDGVPEVNFPPRAGIGDDQAYATSSVAPPAPRRTWSSRTPSSSSATSSTSTTSTTAPPATTAPSGTTTAPPGGPTTAPAPGGRTATAVPGVTPAAPARPPAAGATPVGPTAWPPAGSARPALATATPPG